MLRTLTSGRRPVLAVGDAPCRTARSQQFVKPPKYLPSFLDRRARFRHGRRCPNGIAASREPREYYLERATTYRLHGKVATPCTSASHACCIRRPTSKSTAGWSPSATIRQTPMELRISASALAAEARAIPGHQTIGRAPHQVDAGPNGRRIPIPATQATVPHRQLR